MGIQSVTCWLIVRRYDQLDTIINEELSCSPTVPLEIQQGTSFVDLKSQLRSWLGIPEDGDAVMKLRKKDGTLITLSCLLNGNLESEPFILDIVRAHQTTPSSQRSALPPSYIETVRSKLKCLEKRVERVENLIPELKSRRMAVVEKTAHQLGSKVHFLDKRLDELMPPEWKPQVQKASIS